MSFIPTCVFEIGEREFSTGSAGILPAKIARCTRTSGRDVRFHFRGQDAALPVAAGAHRCFKNLRLLFFPGFFAFFALLVGFGGGVLPGQA